jgi:hypothetical protein
MKRTTMFATMALAVGGLAFGGCNKDEPVKTSEDNKTPGQKAGEVVQNTVDKGNEKAQQAGAALNREIAPSGSDKLTGIRDRRGRRPERVQGE